SKICFTLNIDICHTTWGGSMVFTFLLGIVLLIVGYFTYGTFVEKVFGVKEQRMTPAYTSQDGVDYVPMNTSKNSLIQLLNIAGLWASCAGAVHEYLTGMISIRNRGAHLPELAGKFLGKVMKHVVNAFSILLLLLVGTVFVTAPAELLNNLLNGWVGVGVIIGVIF